MKRIGLKMKLTPGFEAEYKKRHDEIWPELKQTLTDLGLCDYVIYLDEETHILFASLKLKENHNAAAIPDQVIVKKWWAYMQDIMETKADNSPVEVALQEVFYMD
jgi:L-rhamnose mutarotase